MILALLAAAALGAADADAGTVLVPLAPLAAEPRATFELEQQLRAALAAEGVRVLEREPTQRRLQAEAPVLLGCAEGPCAAEVARLFGAAEIIVGSVAGYGGRRTVLLERFAPSGRSLGTLRWSEGEPLRICALFGGACPQRPGPPAPAPGAVASARPPGFATPPPGMALARPLPTALAGAKLGLAFPQLFSRRDAGPLAALAGLYLPWADGRAGLASELGVGRTTRLLEPSDPRVPPGARYEIQVTVLSAALGGAVAIPLGPLTAIGSAGARLTDVRVEVSSESLARHLERQVRAAPFIGVGGAYRIGPGWALLELTVVTSPIAYLIAGAVDVGEVSTRLGYFFSL